MRFTSRLLLALVLASSLPAQITLPPGYTIPWVISAATLGIPGPLGGIEFSADGLTLFVGSGANGSSGAIYAVPVIRDPFSNFVTGLGTATYYAQAPNIDGGLQFGPSGTLFFTRYSMNGLGQLVGTTYSSFPLSSASASVGGLSFVPAGLPNAGDLLVSSYNNGDLFTVGLTSNGNGTYTPTTGTLFASLPGGSEGFRYVPSGPNAGDIIITNYGLGNISIIDIDPLTGQPIGGAASPQVAVFATGIGGAEGFAFDPLTNDFFVSTFGGNPFDSILRITGFPVPQWSLTISAPTVPLAGGVRSLFVQAGSAAANRGYLIACGVSGTSPGLNVAWLHLPLNFDDFTALAYSLVNTPLFANFQGVTDALGNATATMNIPPIPAVSLGVTVSFAGVLLNPTNATSVATQLTIVP